MRRVVPVAASIGVVVLLQASATLGSTSGPDARAGKILFFDNFNRANGPNSLITNEYAYRNPTDPRAVRSKSWVTTSGSFFVKHGVGWTGVPDGCRPDRYSQVCNDSAVFRLHTRRLDFGDVEVSMKLLNHSLMTTSRTPARDIDGVHIWLRYQSEAELYAVSVNRRDSSVVIKKKCAGGPSNGGTYYSLAKAIPNKAIPFGVWQQISVSIRNSADGSVAIGFTRGGAPVAAATDSGLGCPPIRQSGSVGIRGDNDRFSVENFTVTNASP